MKLTLEQIPFFYMLGERTLAELGYRPSDPQLPDILRESANRMRIYAALGDVGLHAHRELLEQSEKKVHDIMTITADAAMVGMLCGLNGIEGVATALEAIADQLEADFPPATEEKGVADE